MMTKPKRVDDKDPDFETNEILHSEHTFKQPLPGLGTIEEFISRGKHTGTLEVNFSRGGKTNARFHQKQDVDVIP
jgi:hypothetical protein